MNTAMSDGFTIETGPLPGLLGDIAALHGRYYAREWGFPTFFEAKVAREMGEFLLRYDPARDLVLSVCGADRVMGSITLDGSNPQAAPGQAHLRWFILDGSLAGQGLGKRLVGDVIAFARQAGMASIYLTTFRGLEPAGTLYARNGFPVVAEEAGVTWGREVVEQRLELVF
jgi:GNAT superfamily N-acetyltransferase